MKNKIKISLFCFIFGVILLISTKVNAASASISASSKNIAVGKTVIITVKASAASWNLKVSGEVSDSIVGYNGDGENQTVKKTYKITPKSEGSYTVRLEGDVTDGDTNKNSDISDSVTIVASQKEDNTDNNTKSSNANLKTLGISPKEYDFTGFTKNTTEYTAKAIPSTVDSLKVTAIAEEKNAKVKITGNTNLEVGTNTIKVVVTAPDGKTTKTYSIRVTKLATEDEKPGNVIDDEKEVDLFLKSLSIDGLTLSPEFSSNVFTYETTINMDENDLNEVKVNAEANNSNAKIEITGNTNLVEGENLINIIVKEEGTSNQTVYQITVNKVSQKSEVLENSNKISKEKIIIAGGIAVIIIVIAVWIIIMKKNKDSYYDYEENDEEQEDTLYNYDNDNEDYSEPYSQRDNLVEELFQKKNKVNNEELNIEDKKTLEEIKKENDRIFKKNVEDESENSADEYEKRKKGKHF